MKKNEALDIILEEMEYQENMQRNIGWNDWWELKNFVKKLKERRWIK